MAGAVLVANVVVLSQTRAIVPAALLVVVLVLILPGRLRRGWLLVVLGVAVAAALPATLAVYGERGPIGGAPGDSTLRSAALAIVLASGVAGAVWGWLTGPAALSRLRPHRRIATWLLVAIPVAAALATPVVVPDPAGKVRDQWSSFRNLNDQDAGDSRDRFTSAGGYRYDLWRIAVKQARDHPLHGVGAGNYDSTYYRERRTGEFVKQPHSLELQMFAELGFPGGLALLLFVGAVLWGGLRPSREASIRTSLPARIAAVGIFGAWLVHTSVDWLYDIPGLTGLALLAAGALLARRVGDEAEPAPATGRRVAVGGVLAAVVVLAASVGVHYAATRYRAHAEAELAENPSAALVAANRALNLNSHDMLAYIVLASAHARRNEFEPARRALQQAASAEPFNYVPWVLMGDLATRRGATAQARRDYGRARYLNPRDSLKRRAVNR
jgi:O-antigen ligase